VPAEVLFGELDGRAAPPQVLAHTSVPGLGHMPPLEDPERIAGLIMASLPERALEYSA
jgi:pimeloyl-ACP methyl ester carboxylesterase